jgi:integrase
VVKPRPYIRKVLKAGRVYWYFRRGPVTERLPDNPNSPEFDAAYWALRTGRATTSKTSFNAIIESYLASPRFDRLAPGTKKEYRRTLDLIREKNGPKDFRRLTRRDVIAARDKYAETWRKANSLVEMLSMLSRHAMDLGWIKANPATGVETFTGGSYEPWPEAKQAAFVAYCLRNDERIALTAYHLGVGTGQRIGDVVKMRWDDFDGDYMRVVQQKTGEKLDVYCPRRLRDYLATLPKSGEYILAKTLRGHVAKRDVQRAVERVRGAIGAQGYVIHGWRYTAAVELAEAGCSDAEIAAVTGHRSLEMVRKYRAKAAQKRMSKAAQEKRK